MGGEEKEQLVNGDDGYISDESSFYGMIPVTPRSRTTPDKHVLQVMMSSALVSKTSPPTSTLLPTGPLITFPSPQSQHPT